MLKHMRLIIPLGLAALLVILVMSPVKHVQAATIDRLAVSCFSTIVTGRVDVSSQRASQVPYVRIQVTKSDDLNTVLATRVTPVRADGTYQTWMLYPRQPTQSLLIVSVGEWDGQVYMAPATLISRVCGTNTPPVTPTAVITSPPITPVITRPSSSATYPPVTRTRVPSTPIGGEPSVTPSPTHTRSPWTPIASQTFPPATRTQVPPTPIGGEPSVTPSPTYTPLPASPTFASAYSQSWTIMTTLTQDNCGGAGEGATVPAILFFSADDTLTTIDKGVLTYNMRLAGTHSGYIGQAYSGEATYTLDLFFDDANPSAFTAYEQVTFAASPGCFWSFEWRGSVG